MKTCPACQRGYDDETLRFCLDDGAVLVDQAGAAAARPRRKPVEPPPTARLPQSAETKASLPQPTTQYGPGSHLAAEQPPVRAPRPGAAAMAIAAVSLLCGIFAGITLFLSLVGGGAQVASELIGLTFVLGLFAGGLGTLLGLISLFVALRKSTTPGARLLTIIAIAFNLAYFIVAISVLVLGIAINSQK